MATGGKSDELDTAAGERPGDVPADLEHAVFVELVEGVVTLRLADGGDRIVLVQFEAAVRKTDVGMDRLVGSAIESP